MNENNFVDELLKHILEGVKIPKVQVERAINPILSLFIESVLEKYFENSIDYTGGFRLISPEFPLKKENNQSTNIDFLLVNASKKILVFFELKTDAASLDNEQIERYIKTKAKISTSSCQLLKDDLVLIHKASKGQKYQYIISKFDSVMVNYNEISNSIIVYLVPSAIVDKTKEHMGIDFVLSYNDLPENIDHKFAEHWISIRKNLLQLDNQFTGTIHSGTSTLPLQQIVQNIKRYLIGSKSSIQPDYFQIGIKGVGIRPNYQVSFDDGSVKTFRFSGIPHSTPIFKQNNLSKEFLWDEFK